MLQNIPKEKVLDVVRQGPTFPAKVAKQLGMGGDTVLVGAILSTLISTGEVKVSTIRIGGSPLYYLPEQESKLEEFIDHLNDKDRRTFKLLKENKILQDTLQDPLTRVSLRAIKDFAKSFEITLQDSKDQKFLFWRFYSEPFDDAVSLAKKVAKSQVVEHAEPVQEQPKQEPTTPVHNSGEEMSHTTIIPGSLIDKPEVQAVLEESDIANQSSHVPEQRHTHVKLETEDVKHSHTQDAKHEHRQAHHETQQAHHVEHHEHHDSAKPKPHHQKEPKAPKESKPKAPSYDFFEIIKVYFASKGLDMLSKEKIKKTEYDIILKNHDANEYIYCKAKDKSSVSEGDLAPALIFAQSKKMPCLFISTGELTKKAELMLDNELKGMKFDRIIINQAA